MNHDPWYNDWWVAETLVQNPTAVHNSSETHQTTSSTSSGNQEPIENTANRQPDSTTPSTNAWNDQSCPPLTDAADHHRQRPTLPQLTKPSVDQ